MTHNVSLVQAEIRKKLNYNIPYYATQASIHDISTDMDNFPYKRFYRGVYYDTSPIVFEREVGWRQLNNSCYREQVVPHIKEQKYCWQTGCNTVFPCDKHKYAKANESHPKEVNISP